MAVARKDPEEESEVGNGDSMASSSVETVDQVNNPQMPSMYGFYPGNYYGYPYYAPNNGNFSTDNSFKVSENNDSDDIDAQMSAEYVDTAANVSEDPQCNPIRQPLAEVLNKWWRQQLPKEEVKALLTQTSRPSNCDGVKNILINKTIYKTMSKTDRDRDHPIKHITNTLIRGRQALVQAWDTLSQTEICCKSKDTPQEVSKCVMPDGSPLNISQLLTHVELALNF